MKQFENGGIAWTAVVLTARARPDEDGSSPPRTELVVFTSSEGEKRCLSQSAGWFTCASPEELLAAFRGSSPLEL
jgi:hypothetical protein